MGNNTEIRQIKAFGSFGSVKLIYMVRNRYAYSYFHYGVDTVYFEADFESGMKVCINEEKLEPGKPSQYYSLECGLNHFEVNVISPNGQAERRTSFSMYRAFPTPTWEKVIENAPWRPRDSAGELVFKDRIWMIGGYVPETVNDVWSTVDGEHWQQHTDVPSAVGVDIPVMVAFNGKIHVFDMAGILYASEDGTEWEVVSDNNPFIGRRKMGGAVFQGKLWVLGGGDKDGLYHDVWSTENGVDWTLEVEHAPWCKRWIDHTVLVYKDKMWLLGGGAMGSGYYPFVAYSDVWCSSDGVHWDCVTTNAPWAPRIWGSTVVYNNRMWMMAGYRSEPESRHFGDVWYSTDGKEWIEFKQHASEWARECGDTPVSVTAPMWADRHESSVVAYNGTLYLIAGMIWPLKNDVWKLKIDGLCFLTQPRFEGFADCLYEYHAFADFSKSGQKAQYRLIDPPSWLKINQETGRVFGVSEMPFNGKITIEAYDDAGETARQEFVLNLARWP